MDRQLTTTGLFWGILFGLGFLVNFASKIIDPGGSIAGAFTIAQTLALLAISALFASSGFVKNLVWVQPVIMLALTPHALLRPNGSFYGLGFFVVAVLTLFRLGFYRRRLLVKLSLSLLYLFAGELYAVLRSGEPPVRALTPIFITCVFVAFFLLAYREKLVVYLEAPRPLLSLRSRGLTEAESGYVRAIMGGFSVKQAARASRVSESTVRNSLARAYRKLGVDDRSGLFMLAERYLIED